MTREELINAGYDRYDPAPISNECVTDLYQKCVKDDIGKKYYINVNRWDFTPCGQKNEPIGYECNVQFRHKKTGEYTDIVCLDGWSVADMEKYYADIWYTGMFRYYEKWGGDGLYEDNEEAAQEEEKTSDEE